MAWVQALASRQPAAQPQVVLPMAAQVLRSEPEPAEQDVAAVLRREVQRAPAAQPQAARAERGA
jgi:hypothetical protein